MAYQLNLNWPEFLEKYWQKKPVVLKNAFANFVDPITPDELAGLAMEVEVASSAISTVNGKPVTALSNISMAWGKPVGRCWRRR